MSIATVDRVPGLDGMVNKGELFMKRRKLRTAKVDDCAFCNLLLTVQNAVTKMVWGQDMV